MQRVITLLVSALALWLVVRLFTYMYVEIGRVQNGMPIVTDSIANQPQP